MAYDPNLSEEQKRRQRELARATRTLPAWAQPEAGPPKRSALARSYEVGQGFAQEPPPKPAAGPQVQLIEPQAPNPRNADDRRSAGLTRIVKSAPGVYTDDPYAQGEERYYGALGQRADVGTPTGITPNTSVADYNEAERQSAFDVNTPDGAWRLAGNAERQRRGLGRMLADGKAVREGKDPSNPQDYQWVPDPETGRNTVMSRAQREAADPKLAAARAAGAPDALEILKFQHQQATDAAAAADRQTGLTRQQQALDQTNDKTLREFAREDPEGYFREQISGLSQMSEDEREEFFSTPAGQRFAGELRNITADASGNQAQGFGDLQEAPWYAPGFGRRLFTGDKAYLPGGNLMADVVETSETPLRDTDIEWLMEYFGNRGVKSERD